MKAYTVLLMLVFLWVLVEGMKPMGKPKRPTPRHKDSDEDDGGDSKPEMAEEGSRGRMEFNLTTIQRQVIVWPKGCAFAIRKLNCTMNEDNKPCKALAFAISKVRELNKCGAGATEVGKNPGGQRRKHSKDEKHIKDLKCIIQASENCALGSASAFCINASALLDEDSFFTTNIYVALEDGTYTYANQTYDIKKGQTKFTMTYSGTTCCDDSTADCYCEDGAAGALELGVKILKPGKPKKGQDKMSQGGGTQSRYQFGTDVNDATIDLPDMVEVDGEAMEMEADDITITENGANSLMNLCVRNISSYFIYDPVVGVADLVETFDNTQEVDVEFGEEPSSSGAALPVALLTSSLLVILVAYFS